MRPLLESRESALPGWLPRDRQAARTGVKVAVLVAVPAWLVTESWPLAAAAGT